MLEQTRVYLDNLLKRDIDCKDWIERKLYSYKNEVIELNNTDRKRLEKLLRDSYSNDTIILVGIDSIKNNYNGRQDVVITFKQKEEEWM